MSLFESSARTELAPVTIAGSGNWLLGHDRIGPRVLERVAGRWGDEVELVDIGTTSLALLDHLRGQELLLVVDACAGMASPGEVAPLPAIAASTRMVPLALISSITCPTVTARERSTVAVFPARSVMRMEPRWTPSPPLRNSRAVPRSRSASPSSSDRVPSPTAVSSTVAKPFEICWLDRASCATRKVWTPGMSPERAVATRALSSLDETWTAS